MLSNFLNGNGTDDKGRKFKEILEWDDEKLEKSTIIFSGFFLPLNRADSTLLRRF